LSVWFYEHNTRFGKQDKKEFPHIASYGRVDHGGRHYANELLRDIKKNEVVDNLVSRYVHVEVNKFIELCDDNVVCACRFCSISMS